MQMQRSRQPWLHPVLPASFLQFLFGMAVLVLAPFTSVGWKFRSHDFASSHWQDTVAIRTFPSDENRLVYGGTLGEEDWARRQRIGCRIIQIHGPAVWNRPDCLPQHEGVSRSRHASSYIGKEWHGNSPRLVLPPTQASRWWYNRTPRAALRCTIQIRYREAVSDANQIQVSRGEIEGA
ncbi:uncharacterized protein B0T15DRAFT_144270 [Chaetomium strumarium]|uniref:Uncharacterized protein n=1 Tax=Chaetomium strumarium TaxID=1170767 RepID=A0AAJ0M2F9_9PEZI|nr:hypothetical protein B0T15DRAFT_144270 [Chaetomium strumarium]